MGSQRNTINFTGDSWLPDDESSSIKPFRDHLHGGRKGVQGSNRWVRRAGKIPEGENGNMMWRGRKEESSKSKKRNQTSSEEKDGHPPCQTRNILFSSWKPPEPGLSPKRSVTPTTESFANVNRLITVTSAEVLHFVPHLNCVRGDTGESHSHAHSWKYLDVRIVNRSASSLWKTESECERFHMIMIPIQL